MWGWRLGDLMLWLAVLAVSFVTITLAELADKTQLVTFSQACRYPAWPVLAGSATALIIVTFIGVVGGTVLYWLLPPDVLTWVAGALFIIFGAIMLWRWYRARGTDEGADCADDTDAEAAAECETSNFSIFKSTFALVALAGKYEAPLAVFLGASVGLVLVSAAGVLAGRAVGGRLSMRTIELLAGLIFIALGVIFLTGVL